MRTFSAVIFKNIQLKLHHRTLFSNMKNLEHSKKSFYPNLTTFLLGGPRRKELEMGLKIYDQKIEHKNNQTQYQMNHF